MTQLKLKTKHSIAPVSRASKQSGFAILMALLVLVLGAAAWYGSTGGAKTEAMKTEVQTDYVANLQQIKERMLAYALLNPEIFDAGLADTSNPGPGYFPCPDVTGNGRTDTGLHCTGSDSLYAMGWVPQKIIDRNFSFLSSSQRIENKRYWFAVDARFLVDATKYQFNASNRFAPLNINTPSLVDASLSTPATDPDDPSYCNQTPASNNAPGCVPPLTLDGKGDIVMVLFYAGDVSASLSSTRRLTSEGVNNDHAAFQSVAFLEQPDGRVAVNPWSYNEPDSTGVFVSRGNEGEFFNDHVIAITREEWNAAMLSRVAKDVDGNSIPDLCEIPLDIESNTKESWFDDCRYSGPAAPPYPCTDFASLSASSGSFSESSPTMMAFSFGQFEFSGLSVDWRGWFGLNQLWSMMGGWGGMGWGGGGGGGGGGGTTITPVENIEGQGWRTALGCPL